MSDIQTAQLLDDFSNNRIAPEKFHHSQHVQTAYALLRHKPFLEAATLYVSGISKLANAAGAPKKFNMTITLAYLGLIAERIEASQDTDWGQFISSNKDLLDKDLLMRWYSPDRLSSDGAHCIFDAGQLSMIERSVSLSERVSAATAPSPALWAKIEA